MKNDNKDLITEESYEKSVTGNTVSSNKGMIEVPLKSDCDDECAKFQSIVNKTCDLVIEQTPPSTLELHNPELKDVDPFDPTLDPITKVKIVDECKKNPLYFINKMLNRQPNDDEEKDMISKDLHEDFVTTSSDKGPTEIPVMDNVNVDVEFKISKVDESEKYELPHCYNRTLIIESDKNKKIDDLTKKIVLHQVGDDESIVVPGGEVGPGGDYNEYTILEFNNEHKEATVLAKLIFQRGPIKDVGENGAQMEHYIAAIIHRLECFQAGKYKSTYNAEALTHLYNAMRSLQQRTLDRIALGVEGTYKTGDVEKDTIVKSGDLYFGVPETFTPPLKSNIIWINKLTLSMNGWYKEIMLPEPEDYLLFKHNPHNDKDILECTFTRHTDGLFKDDPLDKNYIILVSATMNIKTNVVNAQYQCSSAVRSRPVPFELHSYSIGIKQ